MSKVSGLGHVGIFVKDMRKMLDFYTGILGLTITDEGPIDAAGRPALVFMSAHPETEHHEFVLGQSEDRHANAQQVSFTAGSLDELRALCHAIQNHGECTDIRVINHGIAFGCYFRDPENNHIEVYWPTGVDYPQPHAEQISLDQSNEELMKILTDMEAREGSMQHFYGRDVGKRLPAAGKV